MELSSHDATTFNPAKKLMQISPSRRFTNAQMNTARFGESHVVVVVVVVCVCAGLVTTSPLDSSLITLRSSTGQEHYVASSFAPTRAMGISRGVGLVRAG
jgi:hypothetical protein